MRALEQSTRQKNALREKGREGYLWGAVRRAEQAWGGLIIASSDWQRSASWESVFCCITAKSTSSKHMMSTISKKIPPLSKHDAFSGQLGTKILIDSTFTCPHLSGETASQRSDHVPKLRGKSPICAGILKSVSNTTHSGCVSNHFYHQQESAFSTHHKKGLQHHSDLWRKHTSLACSCYASGVVHICTCLSCVQLENSTASSTRLQVKAITSLSIWLPCRTGWLEVNE